METITVKKIVSCIAFSSILGLTACQSTTKDHHSMDDRKHHSKMWHDKHEDLSDNQIIKILSTANNGEIMQANAALPKLKMAQVRQYAQMMIREHSANEQKGQALATRLMLTPQTSEISKLLQRDSDKIVDKLNRSSSDIDKDYMKSQVEVHRKVLMVIDKKLIPNAKNSDLKNMLVQTRTAVATHLKMAEQMVSMMK